MIHHINNERQAMNIHPIMAQALAPFAPRNSELSRRVIDQAAFNDDDWYTINRETMELVKISSCKSPAPAAKAGQQVERGMAAKYMGVWQ